MTPKRGTRGKQGKRGARGPKMTRTEIVAIVKEQYFEERFSQIQQQLDVQLRRTGEIQAQLDQLLRRLSNEPGRR